MMSKDKKNDSSKYFFNNFTHNIIHTRLNTKFILSLLYYEKKKKKKISIL